MGDEYGYIDASEIYSVSKPPRQPPPPPRKRLIPSPSTSSGDVKVHSHDAAASIIPVRMKASRENVLHGQPSPSEEEEFVEAHSDSDESMDGDNSPDIKAN